MPFLTFFLVIATDFGRIFYYTGTVTNCARSGAIYGSTDPSAAINSSEISAAARRDASNLDLTQLTVASAPDNTSNPTFVVVTVSYPFTTISRFPWVPSSMTITRAVRMNVTPLVPN